jgi:hypothetical protein
LGRLAAVLVVAMSAGACSGDVESVDVTGETGICATTDADFSGDPLPGTNLPGRVLEAVVECPYSTMSDDRLSGAARTEFRCEYSDQDGTIVANCDSSSVVTNDGGTWREDDGTFTITGTDIGVQGLVVQDGVRQGTGDYDGLQFTYHMEGIEHTHPWTVTGTIEPSD